LQVLWIVETDGGIARASPGCGKRLAHGSSD
jgi:hypothetical protein